MKKPKKKKLDRGMLIIFLYLGAMLFLMYFIYSFSTIQNLKSYSKYLERQIHEKEYNSLSEKIYWVETPLSLNEETVIYMYYKNPLCQKN